MKKDKIKIVIIMSLIYYIIYFLSGLIFEYQSSPYSFKITEILKNIVFILLIELLEEYIRSRLLNKTKSMFLYIIITIIFTMIKIDFKVAIDSFKTIESATEYLLSTILPKLVESTLLTYLSINGGYLLNFSYIIPKNVVKIFAPIFPNIDWFIDSVLKYIQTLLIFLFINYEHIIRTEKISRRQRRKENPIKNIPILIIVIIIVSFITGIFKYKPVAIISNSMKPVFNRGDICVIEQIKEDEQINKIKINDIIEYVLNGKYIVHRVVRVEKDYLNIKFITKGDNNNSYDLQPVEKEQVKGIAKFSIPYLGYPSIWFSEFISSK